MFEMGEVSSFFESEEEQAYQAVIVIAAVGKDIDAFSLNMYSSNTSISRGVFESTTRWFIGADLFNTICPLGCPCNYCGIDDFHLSGEQAKEDKSMMYEYAYDQISILSGELILLGEFD